jgi:RNA methyltransferase, TrmH family
MATKAEISFVKSLHLKKFRDEHLKFVVEGPKLVQEAVNSIFAVDCIYTIDIALLSDFKLNEATKIVVVSDKELDQISGLQTPNKLVAILNYKNPATVQAQLLNGLTIVLDQISDPGNLGTIIRVAEWFGAKSIICSNDTVDVYNPKVVQASMGSVFRLPVNYTDIEALLGNEFVQLHLPVFGATLSGVSLYETSFDKDMIIVFGNESRGVSHRIKNLLTQSVKIDNAITSQAESLNVSAAVSVFCAEYLRQNRG